MSLMPSLCAALERAGGDRLVMRAGERPHVLAGERRHDVASAVLSVSAVEALAEQILSSAARHESPRCFAETTQPPAIGRRRMTRSASSGSSRTCSACPSPALTTA